MKKERSVKRRRRRGRRTRRKKEANKQIKEKQKLQEQHAEVENKRKKDNNNKRRRNKQYHTSIACGCRTRVKPRSFSPALIADHQVKGPDAVTTIWPLQHFLPDSAVGPHKATAPGRARMKRKTGTGWERGMEEGVV